MHAAGLGSLEVLRDGSDTAQAASFDEAFRPLFSLAFKASFRIVRDHGAAEDVAADVLSRLHLRWGKLGGAGHLDAWVVRCATNRALDVVRRGVPPVEKGERQRPQSFEDDVAARLLVSSAVRRLSSRQREAVALHFLVGLTEREVAEVLGIAEGSVRTHIHRGLRRLRAGLEPES